MPTTATPEQQNGRATEGQPERRILKAGTLQLRAAATEGRKVIEGYAAMYETETQIGPDSWGFREVLAKGCFDAAIGRDDVRALFNHNPDVILGRTKSKTLRLMSDDTGLRYEIDPPNTSQANDLIESIARGDISGSSFSFIATREEWVYPEKGSNDLPLRRVLECELYDVAPVVFPAYEDTTVEMASRAARQKADERRTAATVDEVRAQDGRELQDALAGAAARATELRLNAEVAAI